MTPAEKHALWRRENPVKQRAAYLYARAKVRAEKKGLRFDLSLDAVQGALIAGTCPVTGLQFYMGPSAKGGRGQQQAHPLAPSIDRIDSDKGYTDDNVRVVVWAVNAACSSWGLEAYLAIAARALGVSNPSTDAVIARLQENA